jgi:hypothetical protein
MRRKRQLQGTSRQEDDMQRNLIRDLGNAEGPGSVDMLGI